MKPPHFVKTITLVAHELGIDEDRLWDLQLGMDEYDGVVWVYDIDGKQTVAFTEYGIENLETLLKDMTPGWSRPPQCS